VLTERRHRTAQIKACRQTLIAADPLPDELRDALAKINSAMRKLVRIGVFARRAVPLMS
jgi:hypothetical protein